jgi:SAM-dependent methyltransferase
MPFARFHIAHNFPARKGKAQFQDQYIALRRKEDRLYSDAQVRHLPAISKEHPHYEEWVTRKRSSDRLLKHLRKMRRPLNILEVGCGNGWLSHKLSMLKDAMVTGYDINLVELEQAKRVFARKPNLQFTSLDPIMPGIIKDRYDVIVFAASIQYFSSLEKALYNALQHLQANGSIHIIDSHLYKAAEVEAAKERTAEYYASLGFPALSDHYFHHSINALQPFNCRMLHNPHTFWNRLTHRKDPFHWVCIKKT